MHSFGRRGGGGGGAHKHASQIAQCKRTTDHLRPGHASLGAAVHERADRKPSLLLLIPLCTAAQMSKDVNGASVPCLFSDPLLGQL